ncbi:bifunctional folylpolyglutamate synthase/dihydrofolate synthase [Flaviaesturariibacter flavus]|uniref:Dihydrofolate synthase/folylpolyglutamate synthase n=1 Tax=Flaviaesturariibacter flavus TaxID=2502780 RepID=A0A4R1BNH1_9BACT|nr:folylpolyglutamate synthase/dihydrofolate synthase family protein [Flaviaesturariibacter flavus]TCJ19133.1 bifunctional folylpolyglutamate synthase/dihydrofolate synthase [Flaviaesturariibacter flavus]
MTYAETLDYLFAQLPMFHRVGPAAFRKDLTNTLALCAALGNPQNRFRSIHVGGTNGKGSVSHMLAAVLQEAGYKTGLYTSPHLYDFRERIRINGEMVSEPFVIGFTERVRSLIETIQPSFFEITVAMAFSWFAEQEVDIAVIEVGLGGRIDSTNIITPLLSVITNIGWDHMNLLGDTLEAIAAEKAGIIKKGVPVVIGQWQGASSEVIAGRARELEAPALIAGHRWGVRTVGEAGATRDIEIYDRYADEVATLSLDLTGVYQEENARTAWTALQELRRQGFTISDAAIQGGFSQVKRLTGLMGRWEQLRQEPLLVLDVAHNKDGLEQVRRQLRTLRYYRLHLVFGMVRDKEAETILPLLPSADRYYFTQAHIPRALPVSELQASAASEGLQGDAFEHVDDAIEAALSAAAPDDLVLVCGSIFLVAEVDRARFTKA